MKISPKVAYKILTFRVPSVLLVFVFLCGEQGRWEGQVFFMLFRASMRGILEKRETLRHLRQEHGIAERVGES